MGFSNPTARRFVIECNMLLTHALALSASQFVHKKKSPLIYTSMHSGGFELTKLTYTRLEDNLIRHWGSSSTPQREWSRRSKYKYRNKNKTQQDSRSNMGLRRQLPPTSHPGALLPRLTSPS